MYCDVVLAAVAATRKLTVDHLARSATANIPILDLDANQTDDTAVYASK